MTIPEALGLTFAIWDRSDAIKNDFVSKRCRDLTTFYIDSCFPGVSYLEHSNIDALLRTAAATNSRWLLVQARGHLLLRFDFYQELERFLASPPSSFLIMGHILDRKDQYFEIHNQCFLINLDLYRKLGQPAFGLEQPGTLPSISTRLPKPIRSPDNFHDDYTPPWLKPDGTNEAEYSNLKDGHGIIAASLRAGLNVQGFPSQLRDKKHFLYPEASTSEFERCLRDPSLAPNQEMNQGQRRFLSGMRQNWFACRSSIFLFNTDDIRNTQRVIPSGKNLDALYSVASGFRPLKLLEMNGFRSSTRVVYFDYSQAALDFRKELHEQFDGLNFVDFLKNRGTRFRFGNYQARPANAEEVPHGEAQFAEQFHSEPNYDTLNSLWNRTTDAFGGSKAFQRLWQDSRQLPHQFVFTDLFNTPSALTDLLQADHAEHSLVWWSNSFTTESTRTFMPVEHIQRAYKNFEFTIRGRKFSTFVDGFSDDGRLQIGRWNNSNPR